MYSRSTIGAPTGNDPVRTVLKFTAHERNSNCCKAKKAGIFGHTEILGLNRFPNL